MSAGCTVGPDYARPVTAADEAETFVNVQASSSDANNVDLASEIEPWWLHFGDPVTSDLVRTALKKNNELKAAAANVLYAQSLLAKSRGTRLPDISYSGSRTKTKTSIGTSLSDSRIVSHSTAYASDISISYIVDFFGKLKRTEQAAMADMLAAQASRQALAHSITAQVVRSRVQIATLQRLLNIARANTKSWEDALIIIERRYSSGLIGPLDVHLARENLAAARALEPQIEQSLLLAQHSLDVLLGRRPAASELLPETLPELPDLSIVPVGLPAALLDRRPDVRTSELNLAAATEWIGVSIAALYPDLTLTASGGYRSESLSRLTVSNADVYSAIIALAGPIWKGGQLRAQVKASKAQAQQAAANYAGVVLLALREVEDALVKQKKLQIQYEQLKARLTEALRAEKLAQQRYLKGVEKFLIVLETERRRRTAENQLVETASEMFNARIDLFLALGGDWDESRSAQQHNADNELGTTSDPGVTDG
jgi:NodT family efflux transporter outer membrane factor (OMF) lipoprotein